MRLNPPSTGIREVDQVIDYLAKQTEERIRKLEKENELLKARVKKLESA